jgi:hypothetical protein
MADGSEDDAVGYGRPPVHTRFTKGRSGNPRGRPPGRSLFSLLQAALDDTTTIEVKGRRRRVSKGEAIIAQLVDRSAAADPRALKLLLDAAQKLEPRRPRYEPPGGYPDEEDEAEEAREFLIEELDRLAAIELEEEAAWVETERLKRLEAEPELPGIAAVCVEREDEP